jgi:ribosomal protein S18 acetylase RimI-like enzyme
LHPDLLIRPLEHAHLPAVLAIQLRCYDDSKQEAAAAFASKLDGAPDTSFLAQIGEDAVGYLVAVPVEGSSPLPLNDRAYRRPAMPGALYLHDLAVHPDARRYGVAAALIAAYWAALHRLGLGVGCLTAVDGSAPFWQRHGFQETALDGEASALLAAYGPGTRFMSRVLPGPGSRRAR